MRVNRLEVLRKTSYKRSSQRANYSVKIVIFFSHSVKLMDPSAYLIKVQSMKIYEGDILATRGR
jgi:hypothetical protein